MSSGFIPMSFNGRIVAYEGNVALFLAKCYLYMSFMICTYTYDKLTVRNSIAKSLAKFYFCERKTY